MRKYQSKLPDELIFRTSDISDFPDYHEDCLEEETKDIINMPVLIRSRVKEFSGSGIYKVFLTGEPGDFYIRITSNYSADVILNGVFVTGLEKNGSFVKREEIESYAGISPKPSAINESDINKHMKEINLLEKMNDLADLSPKKLSLVNNKKFFLYRRILENKCSLNIIDNWRWFFKFWNLKEQENFADTMLQSWHAIQDQGIVYRSAHFFPFSPRVIPFTPNECRIMKYMNIEWKNYIPESPIKPELSIQELKEKISNMNEEEIEILREGYFTKLRNNTQNK